MKKNGFLTILAAVIFVSGCCANPDGAGKCKKDEVVAKINNYSLTESDFLNEVRLIAPQKYNIANTEKAKEGALNELITKKVLLQEAQKANFDKDGKFMKEIERYWEQALLKLLMKQKVDEFSRNISPEIPFETRQQILQTEISKWISDIRNSAKIKIYKENLNKIEIGSPSLQK